MKTDVLRDEETGYLYSVDNMKTTSYLRGQVVGLEKAVGFLRVKATRLFEMDKVEEAVALRKLASEMNIFLGNELEVVAQKHEHDFPDIVQKGSK